MTLPTDVKPAEIPEQALLFAQAAADLADKFGVDQFQMTMRLGEYRYGMPSNQFRGELKVHFAATDGRMRPCRNVSVSCESTVTIHLEQNQPSSS